MPKRTDLRKIMIIGSGPYLKAGTFGVLTRGSAPPYTHGRWLCNHSLPILFPLGVLGALVVHVCTKQDFAIAGIACFRAEL